MNLPALASDCINIILSSLDGLNVFHLILCGNRVLSAKIIHSCTSLKFFCKSFALFPFSAFNLPRLQSLSVNLQETYYSIPLRMNHRPPLPSAPVPSLTSLHLEFAQCFSALVLVEDRPLLEILFPNLTTLRLERSVKIASREFLLAIPKTILHLTLKSQRNSVYQSQYEFDYHDFDLLPPSLETLHLNYVNIRPNDTTHDYNGLKFPETLKTLCLRELYSHLVLFHLPPHATHIEMDFKDQKISGSFPTSLIPKSLTTFNISGFYGGHFHIIPDGSYPPNLTEFSVPLKVTHFDQLVGLPKTIKQFDQTDIIMNTGGDLNAILPCIERLSISFPTFYQHLLNNLPLKLKHFYSSFTPASSIIYFPPTLESIGIKFDHVDELKILPLGVKALYLTKEGLICFNAEDISRLPPNLGSISIGLHQISTLDAISRLSISMKTIDMLIDSQFLSLPLYNGMVNDRTFSSYLPHSLTSYTLSIVNMKTLWYEWIGELGHLTKLDTLYLFIDNPVESDIRAPLDGLSRLPASTREIAITVCDNLLENPDCLKMLPSNLTTLLFIPPNNDERRPIPVPSDDCFSQLPKGLTYLYAQQLTGISPNFINVIPPGIIDMDLPDVLKGTLVEYYKRDIWEGHPPKRF
jgi:hypothetical protein